MIYARRGNGSDVYVFAKDDVIECHDCRLEEILKVFFQKPSEMIAHLDEHLEAGHKVPKDCLERLSAEVARSEREHAYLGAWVVVEETMYDEDGKIEVEPRPVIKGIGVFSESTPESLGEGVWAPILESDGATYTDAIRNLRSLCEQSLPWLAPHVSWER